MIKEKEEKDDRGTVGEVALELLKNLIEPLAHEITTQAINDERKIRKRYGAGFAATTHNPKKGAEVITGRVAYAKIRNKDIYGKEKSTETVYFSCSNCGRKIAGTRFAAHIERCLGGRNSRGKVYSDTNSEYGSPGNVASAASSPEPSAPSPRKRRKKVDSKNTVLSRFVDREERGSYTPEPSSS